MNVVLVPLLLAESVEGVDGRAAVGAVTQETVVRHWNCGDFGCLGQGVAGTQQCSTLTPLSTAVCIVVMNFPFV